MTDESEPVQRARAGPALRSARMRILGWILIPVTLVLVLSWFVARVILVQQVESAIQQELTEEVAELRILAAEGVDPQTGLPFRDPRALLRSYLERIIPDPNETMFGIIDGVAESRTTDEPPVRLDEDQGFVDLVSSVDSVTLGEQQTPAGVAQYVAVPVVLEGTERKGVLVVAIFAEAEGAATNSVLRALLLSALAGLAAATVVAWFVAGRVLAPVREVRDAAREITESDLTQRIERSGRRDEVDSLAETFNAMLDRLEEAFATQRAFVDDAGHELRTPLTIVRGHLDLARSESDPQVREQYLTVVDDELTRMTRIVSDLQTLTKAHQPGFLRLTPVDMGDLVDDVLVRSASIADRGWRVDARCEGVIVADRDRLLQALVQLAHNATKHTTVGQEIGIGCRAEGRWVVFWVRDTGSGIPSDQRDRVFERFVRGSGEGAGLGLSIVQAIAEAHGGHARLVDSGAKGATVVILVPRRVDDGEPTWTDADAEAGT